jgi:hypothetical protein
MDYKILGSISTTTVIVLKYGHPDLAQVDDPQCRPHSKQTYRSPSQVTRDNSHVKSWPYAFNRSYARPSDSGMTQSSQEREHFVLQNIVDMGIKMAIHLQHLFEWIT